MQARGAARSFHVPWAALSLCTVLVLTGLLMATIAIVTCAP